MEIPKKFGENTYIQFENGKPVYQFEVEKNRIKKFVNLSKEMPKQIILPKIAKRCGKNLCAGREDFYRLVPDHSSLLHAFLVGDNQNYLKGYVTIDSNCFKGVKDAEIVFEEDSSLAFKDDTFDKDAKIEFVTPKHFELKRISLRYNSYATYEDNEWYLLGRTKEFDKLTSDVTDMSRHDYSICNFDKTNIKISTNKRIKHNEIVKIEEEKAR